ncbi:HAD-like domain-containing protein [Limtongia smithiae]|uniref:HAD-like domain-containing protein n=1 Tax=Limtongia smithiae TaxID=1125753 RepID=UPI0034CE78F9
MAVSAPRPAVRACLFDMDGLLINSEDIYSEVTNSVLKDHGKPALPWHIKASLQGLPGTAATAKFLEWSNLPYTPEELYKEMTRRQEGEWKNTKPMPGSHELLQRLVQKRIPIALASSSHHGTYRLKTAHLEDMFALFGEHKVLGDDPRIPPGKGKPAPDIWQIALKSLNDAMLAAGEITTPIAPEECLVFEDGIPGVKGALAAGCQVVWVPNPEILSLYKDNTESIVGPMGDVLISLEDLDYAKYSL